MSVNLKVNNSRCDERIILRLFFGPLSRLSTPPNPLIEENPNIDQREYRKPTFLLSRYSFPILFTPDGAFFQHQQTPASD